MIKQKHSHPNLIPIVIYLLLSRHYCYHYGQQGKEKEEIKKVKKKERKNPNASSIVLFMKLALFDGIQDGSSHWRNSGYCSGVRLLPIRVTLRQVHTSRVEIKPS